MSWQGNHPSGVTGNAGDDRHTAASRRLPHIDMDGATGASVRGTDQWSSRLNLRPSDGCVRVAAPETMVDVPVLGHRTFDLEEVA